MRCTVTVFKALGPAAAGRMELEQHFAPRSLLCCGRMRVLVRPVAPVSAAPWGYSYEDKVMRHGQGELRHPAIVTILRAGVTKLPLVVR